MKLIIFIMMAFICLSGFCQEEDEVFFEELTQERLKKAERANELNQAREDLERKTYSISDELQKLGREQLDSAALFDDRVQEVLQKGIAESHLRKQSPEFIRAMIMGQAKGKPMEKVFTKFPKLLDISVDIMKDKDALPGLVRIFSRKGDLKNYGIFWILFVIVGYFLRKKLIPQEIPFFKRMMARIFFSLLMSTISLSVFYWMFESEVGPTFQIILKHI